MKKIVTVSLWGIAFLLLTGSVLGLLYRSVLVPRMEAMVRLNMEEELQRLYFALRADLDALRRLAGDYAFWDESVEYLHNGGKGYEEDNLTLENLENLDLDHFIFLDTAGALLHNVASGLSGSARPGAGPLPTELAWLPKAPAIVQKVRSTKVESGVVLYGEIPALVVVASVLPTDGKGPSQGTLAFVRILDLEGMDRLRTRLRSRIEVVGEDDTIPEEGVWIRALDARNPTLSKVLTNHGSREALGWLALANVASPGKYIYFRVRRNPVFFVQAQRGLQVVFAILLALTALFVLGGLAIYYYRWLRPLNRLQNAWASVPPGAPLAVPALGGVSGPLQELANTMGLQAHRTHALIRRLTEESEHLNSAIHDLSRQGLLYSTALMAWPDPVVVLDAQGAVQLWNSAMDNLVEKAHLRISSATVADFAYALYGEARPLPAQILWGDPAALERFASSMDLQGDILRVEEFVALPTRTEGRFLFHEVVRMRTPSGSIVGVVCMVRDITELKRAEGSLQYLNLHDPLTGLPNHAYFGELLRRVDRVETFPLGFLLGDVADLDLVVRTLGQQHGDSLVLAAVALMRETLGVQPMILRVGPARFACVFSTVGDGEMAKMREGLHAAVEQHNLQSPPLPLHFHCGWSWSAEPVPTAELLSRAEADLQLQVNQEAPGNHQRLAQALQMRYLEIESGDSIQKTLETRVRDFAAVLGLESSVQDRAALLARWKDIGKLALPSSIPLKPGPLSEQEYAQVRHHPEIGYRIAMLDPKLATIAELILKHGEWWNGNGYPLGLREEEIPLEGRLVAVVEAFTLMTSPRPRSRTRSPQEAVDELRGMAGQKLDPGLVDCFIEHASNRNWLAPA